LALGANVLNMGIVDSVGGYLVYRAVFGLMPSQRGRLTAAAFAAWSGAVLASLVCSGELVASGIAKANVAFPAMVGVHMLIGLGEAAITAIVIATILKTRPELLDDPGARAGPGFPIILAASDAKRQQYKSESFSSGNRAPTGSGTFLAYGLIVSAALGVFVSPFASQWPDGLERVAETIGFGHRAVARRSLITDYHFPGISNLGVATAISGLVGTLLAFGVAMALSRVLLPSPRPLARESDDSGDLESNVPGAAS
jgi:cobalt/nickel transport system permease protein